MQKNLKDQLADGVIGITMCLMGTSDAVVELLAEAVPERGSDLWRRFTKWRNAQPDQGGDAPFKKWMTTVIPSEKLLPALGVHV